MSIVKHLDRKLEPSRGSPRRIEDDETDEEGSELAPRRHKKRTPPRGKNGRFKKRK